MKFIPQLDKQMKTGGFNGTYFELVIPHVVLQELDALKMAVSIYFLVVTIFSFMCLEK
jgi:rRNA-processing protein FCF1